MVTTLLFLSAERKQYQEKEYYKARFMDADCDCIINVSCDYNTYSKLDSNFTRFDRVEVDLTLRNKSYDTVVTGVCLVE